jgi:formate/nitrite transporter FocA (FNT family)
MFLIPLGMALGADISVGKFLLRNLLPVALGNTFAGAPFMGLASAFFYSPHKAVAAVTHTHLKPV